MIFKKLSPLAISSALVVLIAAIPLLFVLYNSLQLSLEQWSSLWSVRLPELLWNTLVLALLVGVLSLVLGVSTAYFIARRRFVGRSIAIWLMILPLTIPTYVFAHIYGVMLEEDGWLGLLWQSLFGTNSMPPDIYNLGGVTLILSMASFSYVFLLVKVALSHSSQNLEEAARLHGATRLQAFWRVNLPLLRPALAAGLAMVVLHVLSDFGAVSMLRYQTFTLSIYLQMSGRFDYQGAAGLALILVLLSLSFLMLERFFRKRQRYYASSQTRRVVPKQATTKELLLIWGWLGMIALFAFLLPLAWMLTWSWEAWLAGFINERFWEYSSNSMILAALAATVAVVAGLPIALYHAKKHSRLSQGFLHTANVGFVLPGPVIALGILTFILAQLPVIYGTLAALVIALVIRFLPLAIQSQEAAAQKLTPSMEQAGRILGAGPFEAFRRITLPIMSSGIATAWVLVFIDVLKELPATLIMRPTGFDTLPIRIWIEASEEMLELAAPAALMLVVATLPALWLLMRSEKQAGSGA